jgi:acetolactate synthase-1/2/3 large subunit
VKVHTALAATLTGHHVTTMFGLVGDGNMFFADRFALGQGGRYVAAAHEAATVMMAAGYASASGAVGVATVTHGPGLANTFGALVEATREHAPVVLVAGDTAADRAGHAQKIDQASVVLPTGAGFEPARSPETAPADLARALRRASAERRPVVFNIPVNFQFEETEYPPPPQCALALPQAVSPDPAALDAAVGIIASSRRPLVLAGAGAVSSGAGKSLRRLAAALGAPLATTLPAKGIFADDPHDLGVLGTFATARAVEVIMQSDAIIVVGAGMNEYTGGGPGSPFFQGKRIVQCDINPAVIGAQCHVDAGVVADAAAFADTVVEWLTEADYSGTGFRDAVAGQALQPTLRAGRKGPGDVVHLTTALLELNRVLPGDRSVVVDGGRFMGEAVKRMDVASPRASFCSFRGFAPVGHGLASAVGVGCARPDSPVVAVVGDGGFMLGGMLEFNTAVRHGVDLIVVVCNDGSYGSEYLKLEGRDFSNQMSMFAWPDFAPVAAALGGEGFTVSNDADLAHLGKVIAGRRGPLLIDVKLDAANIPHGQ